MENSVPTENQFAQRLAANEKKTRDRAIKRLNKYLTARSRHESGLSDADLLKIWKGLFYCMWMQDKPLIQEELSQRITSLLYCFSKTEDSLRFVKVFLETMSREWNGIDRLRLDKFMMMTRDMLHQTFLLMSKGNWQEDHCRQLTLSVYRNVMCAHEAGLPDGLKLHLADIFLDELVKVSTDQLTSEAMLILLQPFIEFVLLTNKLELAHRVMSVIIYKFIKPVSTRSEVAEDEDTDCDTEDKTYLLDEIMEVDVSSQQKLEKGVLFKWMFDLASQKVIRASNRALIYKLINKNSGLSSSNVGSADGAEQTSGAELGQHSFVCDALFSKAVDQEQVEQTGSSGMTLSAKKKVIFDLKRNSANQFQDYLESLAKQPESPFVATKCPVTGILKSPGNNSPALTSSSSATFQFSSQKGGDKRTKQLHESPVSRNRKREQTDNSNPSSAKKRKTKTVDDDLPDVSKDEKRPLKKPYQKSRSKKARPQKSKSWKHEK